MRYSLPKHFQDKYGFYEWIIIIVRTTVQITRLVLIVLMVLRNAQKRRMPRITIRDIDGTTNSIFTTKVVDTKEYFLDNEPIVKKNIASMISNRSGKSNDSGDLDDEMNTKGSLYF